MIYCGTASKSLAPGLRLAWLVPPPWLLDEVVEAKRAMGALPAVFEQLTLAEFLASGAFDRHVRRARIAYRRRRDRLIARLADRGLEVSGIAAGLVPRPPAGGERAACDRTGRRARSCPRRARGIRRARPRRPARAGHRLRPAA